MKKTLALILAMLLSLSMLAGCGQQQSGTPATEAPAEESSAVDAAPATRVITDGLGREIEVPTEINSIVTLGNATRMLVYLGLQDKMVTTANGDQNDSLFMAYGCFNHEAWADLPATSAGGYGEILPEVILEANPDIILCTYEEDIVNSIEEQLGRSVVAAPQGTLFGEDYKLALRVFGDACGVPERAEEIISFMDNCLADLDARTKDIPDEDKPLVLGAAATFRGGHGIEGVYANDAILASIHANDVAAGIIEGPHGVEVDREQILAWDPDIIILDSGNLELVKNQYAEDPSFFEQLSAVKNGKVYQWPNSTANYTNVEIPLVSAYYAGSLLFPDAFADVDFEAKANEIFSFFLGHDGYLDLLTEAGLGYGAVTLG